MSLFWKVIIISVFYTQVKGGTSLSIPYQNAVIGYPYNITCQLDFSSSFVNVSFRLDYYKGRFLRESVCSFLGTSENGSCIYKKGCNHEYDYICDPENKTIILNIPSSMVSRDFHRSSWRCIDFILYSGSNQISLYIDVPVTVVNITTPTNDYGYIEVESGSMKTLTCITGPARPYARVRWFMDISDYTPQSSVNTRPWYDETYEYIWDDDRVFVTTSALDYRGNVADHKKTIYCEAGNIKGRKIKSKEYILYIYHNQTIDGFKEEQSLSFEAGLGTGAGVMFVVFSLFLIVAVCIKRLLNANDKSRMYEDTNTETSDRNVYNELSEIPRAREHPLNNAEARATYEDVDTIAKR